MVQTWFAIFSQSFIRLIWFCTTVMIYPLVCAGCVLFVFLIHLHKAADACWALSTATSGYCELPVAFSSVTTPVTASCWRERQCENTRALVSPGLCSHLGPASSNSSRERGSSKIHPKQLQFCALLLVSLASLVRRWVEIQDLAIF